MTAVELNIDDSPGFQAKLVQSRFSRAAEKYKETANIQNDVAREMAVRVQVPADGTLLDVGAGTGMFLEDICVRLPEIRVVALDVAWGMIVQGMSRASHAAWIQSDAEHLPFNDNVFDVVVSSSAYQWVGDLRRAFSEAQRILKPEGRFYAVLFGKNTLKEFFESLEYASLVRCRKEVFSLGRLPSRLRVARALAGEGWRDVDVRVETRTLFFPGVFSILRWLKSVGGNSFDNRFFLGKELLREAQDYYTGKYGGQDGLAVTFEVVWVTAQKDSD